MRIAKTYKKGSVIGEGVNTLLVLFIGLSVVTMVAILTSNLSAKIYGQFEDDIAAISDTNVQDAVEATSLAGFEAQQETAEFTPVVAIVMIIALIMAIFLSVFYGGFARGMGGGSGGAL